MEKFPEQKEIFELTNEQRKVADEIILDMENAIEAIDIENPEDTKKVKDFMLERGVFQDELERSGVDFSRVYLWHILVGSTISGSERIEMFDTPDGKIEKFIKEKLLPIIRK